MKFSKLTKIAFSILFSLLFTFGSVSTGLASSVKNPADLTGTVSASISPVLKAHMLTSFQVSPLYRSKASLSPGGTNTLIFKYALSGETQMVIEVLIDGTWKSLLKEVQAKGSKTFSWDGRIEEDYINPGTYSLRAYSVYQGLQSKAKTFKLKIYGAPAITGTLDNHNIRQGSKKKVTLTLKLNIPSNVKVTIMDSSKEIATIFNKAMLPGKKKISWNGKNSGGAYVPAGDYFFSITAGTANLFIPIKVTPPLYGTLQFPTLGNLSVTVRDSATPGALTKGALWDQISAYPGNTGNCLIYGHRTTVFRTFGNLHIGDPVQFKVGGAVLNYKIVRLAEVLPSDSLIHQTYDTKMLTMITCYPFIYRGHAPRRFLAIAEQVE